MSWIARSAFVFLALFVSPVFAATIVVGPPPASIQAAINSAASGDTIQLSAGTYVQEFQVISKSLTIVGAGQNATIVQAPGPSTRLTQSFTFGVTTWAVVMVDNQAAPTPQTVDISNLTVDGGTQQDTTIPPIYGSSNRFFAIGYHNAGGTIQSVHTTNTRQTANFNELAGGGIINASDTGTVIFNVTNSLIDFYQRIGIDCRGAALTANVSAQHGQSRLRADAEYDNRHAQRHPVQWLGGGEHLEQSCRRKYLDCPRSIRDRHPAVRRGHGDGHGQYRQQQRHRHCCHSVR